MKNCKTVTDTRRHRNLLAKYVYAKANTLSTAKAIKVTKKFINFAI